MKFWLSIIFGESSNYIWITLLFRTHHYQILTTFTYRLNKSIELRSDLEKRSSILINSVFRRSDLLKNRVVISVSIDITIFFVPTSFAALLLINSIVAVPIKKECDKVCSHNAPICAGLSGTSTAHLRTFKNTCELDKYNCENRTGEWSFEFHVNSLN